MSAPIIIHSAQGIIDTGYIIDDTGRVTNAKTGREKRPSKAKNGYMLMVLWFDGKQHVYYVHRLVFTAFFGEILEGCEINHKDENKENNNLFNLEMVSHKYNINYGTRNQRMADTRKRNQQAKRH